MKKILYIIEADLKSGAGLCAIELIGQIAKHSNFKPIVVTQYPSSLNKWCDQNNIENYHVHYARTCSLGMGWIGWLIAFCARPLLNFLSLKKLKQKINFNNIDIIHSNAVSIDFGAYVSKKYNIPHVWHIRDFLIFNKVWPAIIPNLAQYIGKNSQKIITVSNALKDHLTKQSCDISKISTIYDGINSLTANPKPKQSNNSNIMKVVCVGVYSEGKGQKTLLEAISLIPITLQEHFEFDFYGDDDNGTKKMLFQFVQEKKLHSIVNFNNHVENVSLHLQGYHLGIQPSHSEGFSRVTAEYMAAGLCVIAAKEGAIPELIQHNENGYLYEDYNTKELANLLIYCYEHQDEMRKMANAAQKKALNEYTVEKNFKRILCIYNETIES